MFRRSGVAAAAAVALVLGLLPQPSGSANAAAVVVASTWTGTVAAAGAIGSATVRAFATGNGSIALDVRGIVAGGSYPVGLYRGACGTRGSRLLALGSTKASSAGRVTRTIALQPADVAAIQAATSGISKASVRLGTSGSAPCATLVKSLAATPRIWFAPLPPMPIREGRPYLGSTDFADLFADDAAWRKAAGRTHVFKLYGEWLAGTATNAQLRRLVTALERRGIAIAIEVAPLTSMTCGRGIEGFGGGAGDALALIRRIETAGGTVRFLAMDEPYFFGSLYTGADACRWSAQKVAQQVVAFSRAVQRSRPKVVIGDIEPLPFGVTATDYEGWMAAYRSAAGTPLPFFHLDLDWGRPDWLAVARRLQGYAGANGVRYGMIYNGHHDDSSDAEYIGHARDHFVEFETGGGRTPGDAIFQSWHDHPDRVLPETDPTTFTGLLVDYVRTRTTLRLEPVAPGPGGALLGGSLTTLGGAPVGGATVKLSAVPLDGPYQVLDLTGRVPANATTAVVGIRVNHEEAGPGPADLTFYEVAYTEGVGGQNRVPNPRFEQNLDYWGVWGDGLATTTTSDRGGRMLRVMATTTQSVGLNSSGFEVTHGADYRLSVAVRVPEGSIGAAYIATIFLDGTEVARHRLSLAPAPIRLASVVTIADGSFSVSPGGLEAGRYTVQAAYAGDRSRWPASATSTVTLP